MNNKHKQLQSTLISLAAAGALIVGVALLLPNLSALALEKEAGVQKTTAETVNDEPLVTYGHFDLSSAQEEAPAKDKKKLNTERASQSNGNFQVWKNNKQVQAPQPLGEEQQEIASFAAAEFDKLYGFNPAAENYILHLRHTINQQEDGTNLDFWMAQWEPIDFEARLLDTQNKKPFETYTYAFYTDTRTIYLANANHYLGDGSPGLYDSFAEGDPTGDALWKRKENGDSSLTAEERALVAALEASREAAYKKHEALFSANQQTALEFLVAAGLVVKEVVHVGGYSGGTADWGTEVVLKLDSGETVTVCVSDITHMVSQFKYGENA